MNNIALCSTDHIPHDSEADRELWSLATAQTPHGLMVHITSSGRDQIEKAEEFSSDCLLLLHHKVRNRKLDHHQWDVDVFYLPELGSSHSTSIP